MSDFELNARSREDAGKGASRRLRRLADEVPAIVYGGTKEAEKISLRHRDLAHAMETESFYSRVINLNIDGMGQDVVLKDIQRHPAKAIILHADFLRVDKDRKLNVRAPLHFINEDTCVGVKMQGGVITHSITELEISCLPADLPEYIDVDMADVTLDQILHISDIELPEGVESVALSYGEGHDLPVAAIHMPRAVVEEGPVTDGEAEGAVEDAAEAAEKSAETEDGEEGGNE